VKNTYNYKANTRDRLRKQQVTNEGVSLMFTAGM
jgi:hypothetical protein